MPGVWEKSNSNLTPAYQHFKREAALCGLMMEVPVAIEFLVAQRYVVGDAFTGSVKG
jgi:ABC-type maltose transport system permease subunit